MNPQLYIKYGKGYFGPDQEKHIQDAVEKNHDNITIIQNRTNIAIQK